MSASVLGEPVELVAVSYEGTMLGLRAKCRRRGRAWDVAAIDVDLGPDAGPDLEVTMAGYRRRVRGRR